MKQLLQCREACEVAWSTESSHNTVCSSGDAEMAQTRQQYRTSVDQRCPSCGFPDKKIQEAILKISTLDTRPAADDTQLRPVANDPAMTKEIVKGLPHCKALMCNSVAA